MNKTRLPLAQVLEDHIGMRGTSIRALAQEIGIDHKTVAGIVAGLRKPSVATMLAISAWLFGVSSVSIPADNETVENDPQITQEQASPTAPVVAPGKRRRSRGRGTDDVSERLRRIVQSK